MCPGIKMYAVYEAIATNATRKQSEKFALRHEYMFSTML
jgi:hypothetical protein